MKKRISFILFAISGFLLWGCYPQGPEYVEDMDIVLTYHNPTYDFSVNGTYAMPDKIVKITGNKLEGEEPEFIPDATGDLILARIEQNMSDLGYTRVAIDADPDLLLAPASWETTTIYYYYDYWYWWYGGYYPYWGYPMYYSSYTTGTLMMNLFDPDEIASNGNVILQWAGAGNGLLEGVFNATRVYGAIDKAFALSPYLQSGAR